MAAWNTNKSTVFLICILLGFAACASIPREKESLELIAMAEKRYGQDHVEIISPVVHMALVYTTRGHHKKAVPFYERAVDLSKKYFNPNDSRLSVSMLQLAQAYDLAGHPDKADPIYDELLVLYKKQQTQKEKALADVQSKPEGLRSPAEKNLIVMSQLFKPTPLSESLKATVHTLKMHGRYEDMEPLIKRIEWLHLKEEKPNELLQQTRE